MPDTSDAIVCFVRDTLGCGCPDEVFRDIATRRLPEGGVEWRIGGRLLLYVMPAAEAADEALAGWIADGIAARDRDGFNRFRLVLGGTDPPATASRLLALFNSLTGFDERAHLHCLPGAAIDRFVGPASRACGGA